MAVLKLPTEEEQAATAVLPPVLPVTTQAAPVTQAATTGANPYGNVGTRTSGTTTTGAAGVFTPSVPAAAGQYTPTQTEAERASAGLAGKVTTGQYANQLEGFDAAKLADPAHTTLKYTFARIASKYPPTPAGLTSLLSDPDFQKLGMQSLGNGVFRLPDGTNVDVIRGFNAGGYAWQWGAEGAAGTTGTTAATSGTGTSGTGSSGTSAAGNYTTSGLGTYTGSSEFTDPTTANLEALINARIQELTQPVTDTARQQYADLLQQNITSLGQTSPELAKLQQALNALGMTASMPTQAEVTGTNLGMQYQTQDPAYQAAANQRIQQLQADPYTGAEWEAYRTNALDPIEADRTAALQRALAQISDRGMDPTSGIAQALQAETNRGFDASRAQAQNELAMNRVATRAERQGQAFDVQTALANLLQQRQGTGLGYLTDAANSVLNREGVAAQTYGTLSDIGTQRQQEQLNTAQTLSALSQSVRGEEQTRAQEAIGYQGVLAELPERRLQLALQTLGQGEGPDSLSNSLLSLAGLSNATAQNQTAQNASTYSGLGSLLGWLTNMGGTSATGTTANTTGSGLSSLISALVGSGSLG